MIMATNAIEKENGRWSDSTSMLFKKKDFEF